MHLELVSKLCGDFLALGSSMQQWSVREELYLADGRPEALRVLGEAGY